MIYCNLHCIYMLVMCNVLYVCPYMLCKNMVSIFNTLILKLYVCVNLWYVCVSSLLCMCTAGCEISPERQLSWYWFIRPDCAFVGRRHRRVCAGFLRPQGSHHNTCLLTRWEVSGSCRCERVHVGVWVECVRIILDGVLRSDDSAWCHSSTKIPPNSVLKDIVAVGDKRCVSTHLCVQTCVRSCIPFHFCSATVVVQECC